MRNDVDFYRRFPDKFVEKLFSIKLLPYQKIVLRLLVSRSAQKAVEKGELHE